MLSSEVVHHIDEDKTNDSPSNLMVFKTNGDHSRYHKLGGKGILTQLEDGAWVCGNPNGLGDAGEVSCAECGQVISLLHVRLDRMHICTGCKAEKQRKVKRPSKEQLLSMVWEKPTILLAKELGVTDSAIGKWCRSYGIEKPPRGYWSKLKASLM